MSVRVAQPTTTARSPPASVPQFPHLRKKSDIKLPFLEAFTFFLMYAAKLNSSDFWTR